VTFLVENGHGVGWAVGFTAGLQDFCRVFQMSLISIKRLRFSVPACSIAIVWFTHPQFLSQCFHSGPSPFLQVSWALNTMPAKR